MLSALGITGIFSFFEFLKTAVFAVGYIQGGTLFPEPLSRRRGKKLFRANGKRG